MRASRRKQKQSDWQFAMDHIGRELREAYPPQELTSKLHALAKRLERKTAMRRTRQQRNKGEERLKS
jgi:hypothetical protein